METYINTLLDENSKKSFTLKTTWEESDMVVSILEDKNAWTGKVSYVELSEFSHTFGLSEEDHRNLCKEIFRDSDPVFSYHLSNETFVWKKKILTDMKIIFGRIEITKADFQNVYSDIIESLITENKQAKSKINQLEKDKETLSSENTKLYDTLEKFTADKILGEQILYGKFVALLNNKKTRIESLESLVFKNLCSDTQETKALKEKPVFNSDSDTDIDDPESLNTTDDIIPGTQFHDSEIPGPSGIQFCDNKIQSETDTDESDFELSLAAKKMKLNKTPQKFPITNPNTKDFLIKLRSKEKITESTEENVSTDKIEIKTVKSPEKKENSKPSYEDMDSQELLDMM